MPRTISDRLPLPWAGQIRTVAIAKGSLFRLPRYIESSSAGIFRALRSENFLRAWNVAPSPAG